MRFQDGTDISNGRVEICLSGSVCNISWEHTDEVLCAHN